VGLDLGLHVLREVLSATKEHQHVIDAEVQIGGLLGRDDLPGFFRDRVGISTNDDVNVGAGGDGAGGGDGVQVGVDPLDQVFDDIDGNLGVSSKLEHVGDGVFQVSGLLCHGRLACQLVGIDEDSGPTNGRSMP
jgi:hypothetical protein